jgi:hypothetical protein
VIIAHLRGGGVKGNPITTFTQARCVL